MNLTLTLTPDFANTSLVARPIPSLWNSVIVTTASMPEGKSMTIDTRFTTLLDREQMSALVSNSHQDYFTRNLVAIRAELRAGLEVTDASAVYSFELAPTTP